MRVAQIIPGSGGTFYCENCMRDLSTILALQHAGVDVVMVPMYLPIYADDSTLTRNSPVFFGGINVYLQQRFGIFRHTPRWLDRIFDSRWLLGFAANREGSTSAKGLGKMTLSMLRGEEGRQAKEARRLVSWLREQGPFDVVHISTVMLVGLAGPIRTELGIPVVCSLQDEDVWIDALDGRYPEYCWREMETRSADVNAFITVSDFYGEVMRQRLGLGATPLHKVYVGLPVSEYKQSSLPSDPPVLGYLSKLTPGLGLDAIVDAFISLRRRPEFASLRLHALGGLVGKDKAHVDKLLSRLRAEGVANDVVFDPDMERDHRLEVLSSLTLMSVPMNAGEAFGVFMVEAWCAGVPVVQPRVGAFPELIEATNGGWLYDPDDPDALVRTIATALADRPGLEERGAAGRAGAEALFTSEESARKMVTVYRSVAGSNDRSTTETN